MTDRALDLVARWPVANVVAAVIVNSPVANVPEATAAPVDTHGPLDRQFRLASISKTVTAWACLVAVEEGIVALDTPIGQPGCTLEHLLSHAGGYPFEGRDPIVAPERTRIYSNSGIDLAADAIADSAGIEFAEYLFAGVLEPLGMTSTNLRGSPAHGLWSTADDVVRFMTEVMSPTLISEATAADAIRPHFDSLGGIVPGVGRFDRCPWGLGFEVRGSKSPHWTGKLNSPATFGHFGGAGTMMWIDPVAGVGAVALTDRPFDEWSADALQFWPQFSDAVLTEFGSTTDVVRGGAGG